MKQSLLYFACIVVLLSLSNMSYSQGVAISTDPDATPDPSAMLDVQSAEKGMLVPRMTQMQRDAIANPATGLLIFQTDSEPGFYFNAGTPASPVWQGIAGSDGIWQQTGENIYRINGNTGIGEINPTGKLHISSPGQWNGISFSGTGLNDLSVNISGYNGSGATSFAIRIQNAGPIPNHIEISSNGGSSWSAPFAITPIIDIGFGVTASFGNTHGYTFGDRWDWTLNENYYDILVVQDDKVGIGTAEPTQKLDVVGQIRIRGGAPGEGKVLTSDANGNANWQDYSGISQLSCIDIDDNAYPTILIGNQMWIAENLRVTKYRNGDPIPNITNDAEWGALTSGAYSWYQHNQTEYGKYGILYNWYAVNDLRGLCPEGWRVPSDDEWTTFENMLGGGNVAGGKIKAGSPLWNNPNTDATNSSGFSALPGGFRLVNGIFLTSGGYGIWWTTTDYFTNSAISRTLSWNNGSVISSTDNKAHGFSVRCLKD